MVVIRDATRDDKPSILELLVDLGRPKPDDDADAEAFDDIISGYIHDADRKILVADFGGAVVGLVSVIFLVRLNQKRLEMYIPELIVHRTHRGQRIGRMLIDFCKNLAAKRGCYRIRLESADWREDSHTFYARVGFRRTALSFELPITSVPSSSS